MSYENRQRLKNSETSKNHDSKKENVHKTGPYNWRSDVILCGNCSFDIDT